jgi:hypothetical protein
MKKNGSRKSRVRLPLISVEESDELYKSLFNTNLDPLPSTPNFELLDQSDQAPPSPKCNQIRKFFPEENFILCSSMWEEERRVSRFFC